MLKLERDPTIKGEQKLFFGLFFITFLVAPFYFQPNPGGEGLNLPFNSTVWIATSLFTMSGFLLAFRKGELKLPKHFLLLAAMPIGFVISGFISGATQPTEWLFRLGYVFGGYLFFVALFQFSLTRRHIEGALYLFVAAGLIHTLIGYLQASGLAKLFPGLIPFSASNQAGGIFQQVNVNASFLATVAAITLYLATTPGFKKQKPAIRLCVYTTYLSALTLCLATGSRTGLIAIIIVIPLIVIGKKNIFKAVKPQFLIIALLTAASIPASVTINSGLQKSLTKLDRLQEGTNQNARMAVYEISINTFLEAPLTGHGLGSFQTAWAEQRVLFNEDKDNQLAPARFTHPHNEIMLWLVEGGVIAVSGMLIMLTGALKLIFNQSWRRGLCYSALCLPIIFHTQLELPFYLSVTHWVTLFFMLFVTSYRQTVSISINISVAASNTLTVTTPVLTIAVSGFFIHTLFSAGGTTNYIHHPQSPPAYLTAGINNLYFNQLSEYMLMRRTLLASVYSDDPKGINQYLLWAEQYLEHTPDIQTYVDCAIAHLALSQHQQAHTSLKRGLNIYPGHESLERAMKEFENGELERKIKQSVASAANRSQQPQSQSRSPEHHPEP